MLLDQQPPYPEALRAFAASCTGEYADCYQEILSEAFTSHGLILNAKQLRELAGGGSQTTAQRTITAWRQDLSRKLAMRVRLGAQLPDDVLQAANGMMEALWMRARDGAAQEYAQDRAQHEAAQADGAARLAETRVELQQAREELDQAKGLLISKDAQMREMRAEIAAANERLAQAARDFAQERRARSEQASQARAAQEALERALQEAEERTALLREDMARTQREAAQRFDRMLVEHREAVSSVQRSNDERLAEKEAQLKRLQSRLDAVSSEKLDLQMQVVRSTQQIEHMSQQAALLRAELDSVRAQLQASRDQVQITQAQLIEHLKAAKAQAQAESQAQAEAATTAEPEPATRAG
jgi:chromosome segregation ATPase